MKQKLFNNQQGFSSVVLLIAAALVIGIIVITYGYFIMSSGKSSSQQVQQQTTVSLTKQDPLQTQVGTPECPELDYTGCDKSGDFMTWTDDGVR